MAFTLWGSKSRLFYTGSGSIPGADWMRGNANSDYGNPIWTDDEINASTYLAGTAQTYDFYITGQDGLTDQTPSVLVATPTLTYTFGTSVSSMAGSIIFSKANGVSSGGALWFQNDATSGLDLEFETFTDNALSGTTPPSQSPITLSGTTVRLMSGIASGSQTLLSWTYNDASATDFVVGYAVKASATTENIYFQGFSSTGTALGPATEVLAGANISNTDWFIGLSGGNYYLQYSEVNGSSTGIYNEQFTPSTGVLGTATVKLSQPNYTQYFGIDSETITNAQNTTANKLTLTEGITGGEHVLQVSKLSSSNAFIQVSATFNLTATTADHWQLGTGVYDPTDGLNDNSFLIYTDNGQVHLEELSSTGTQIGSDFIVPNLTTFGRIEVLGQRVEISYTVADPNGGTDEASVIYDADTSAFSTTIAGGNGQYYGTTFSDTFTDASGNHEIAGGGGSDTLVEGLATSAVTLSMNAAGYVTVSASDRSTLLEAFTTVQMSDSTAVIAGNKITDTFTSGAKNIYTFNITGQIYTETDKVTDASGNLVSLIYSGYAVNGGQSYSSAEYDYSFAKAVIGNKLFYTGITGQNYTSDEYDYDGGGHLTRVDFTNLTSSAPLTSYEYDYNEGILTGSKFEYAFSSTETYEVNYAATGAPGAQALSGERFFYIVSGEPYTNEEADYDANNALTKVITSGYSGQPYSSVESDYASGNLTGQKVLYTNLSGSYSTEEVDTNAAGQLTKAIYSGFAVTSSSGVSSVEDDFSAGTMTRAIYTISNVTGASYSSYENVYDGSNNLEEQIYNFTNGTHREVGFVNNLTFNSLGDDKITGGGTNETFVFSIGSGQSVLQDFSTHATGSGHDTISLASGEFANFAAVMSSATNSGANVIITAANGDSIQINNMTTATLAGLSADFTFHA